MVNPEQAARHRRSPASSSSRPAPAPGRRRCSSSESRRPCSSAGSRSTRSSSSPTRSGRPASFASGYASGCASVGRRDLARDVDGAWISTIHGFCSRLLRMPPVRSGRRPSLPRARREPGLGARGRGVHRRAADFCAGRRARAPGPACRVRRARPAHDAARRLRAPAIGRPPARARASRQTASSRPGSPS